MMHILSLGAREYILVSEKLYHSNDPLGAFIILFLTLKLVNRYLIKAASLVVVRLFYIHVMNIYLSHDHMWTVFSFAWIGA